MSETEAPIVAEEAASPPTGKPLLKRLKAAGIISAIVVVQCLMAYFLFPKGSENTASASLKKERDIATAEAAKKPPPTPPDQTEVDLGAFNLTVYNPKSNSNLLIDFHLYGTVAGSAPSGEKKEEADEDDAAKLERMLKGHKHRFRDQVIMTVRNSQMTDLADPGLGLLKRQILGKTNALLGDSLLKEIIFSDFVVVEQ
ncbi:MAG TPA: flagellar basal body-associated FliL family protein [Pirellulales bacterium]|jgi:flagellar FliL protein